MLSSAQKAYIRHLVARHADSVGTDGKRLSSLLNDQQIADLFGLHVNTLVNWKHNREFSSALDKAIEQYETDSDYFASVSRQRVLDEAWKQYTTTTDGAEKRKWWKEIERITSAVRSAGETVDLSDLSDDDLLAMCLSHDVSVAGLSSAELALLASKEKKPCRTRSGSSSRSSSADSSSGEPDTSQPDSAGTPETECPSPRAKRQYRRRKPPSQPPSRSKTGRT
jgi:hypothetical protein